MSASAAVRSRVAALAFALAFVAVVGGCSSALETPSKVAGDEAELRRMFRVMHDLLRWVRRGVDVTWDATAAQVDNTTGGPIVCGALPNVETSPSSTVIIQHGGGARIPVSARHFVACSVSWDAFGTLEGTSGAELSAFLGGMYPDLDTTRASSIVAYFSRDDSFGMMVRVNHRAHMQVSRDP